MSVIQPPPPRTPADDLSFSVAWAAWKAALYATGFLLVICIGASRLPLGVGDSAFSREFFALALGLLGLFGILGIVWIVITFIHQQQKASAQYLQHHKPASTRASSSDQVIALVGVAIISLVLGGLGILTMLATPPPTWMLLAAALIVVLVTMAGALWKFRQQTTLYRTKAER